MGEAAVWFVHHLAIGEHLGKSGCIPKLQGASLCWLMQVLAVLMRGGVLC